MNAPAAQLAGAFPVRWRGIILREKGKIMLDKMDASVYNDTRR